MKGGCPIHIVDYLNSTAGGSAALLPLYVLGGLVLLGLLLALLFGRGKLGERLWDAPGFIGCTFVAAFLLFFGLVMPVDVLVSEYLDTGSVRVTSILAILVFMSAVWGFVYFAATAKRRKQKRDERWRAELASRSDPE